MKNVLSAVLSNSLVRNWLPLSFACLLVFGCGPVQQPVSVAPSGGDPANPAVDEINRQLTILAQQPAIAPGDYQLGPEDMLKITLYNVPPGESLTPREMTVRVSQDGKINLPLLGDLPVEKLSTFKLERLLRERYGKYIHNPQVGVQIAEHRSQQISVLGAVQKPGVFQLIGPRTLVDVLAMAGGISPKAGNQVHVISKGPEGRQSEVIDLFALATNPTTLNRPLHGGDVVNVPEAGTFFVDGAVGKPGSYPLTHTYTLTQAIAVAGGLDAVLSDNSGILLFRRRDHLNFDRIPIDLNAIRNQEAPDPKIQPEDVIVVPIHTGKYIVERFLGRIGLPRVPTY